MSALRQLALPFPHAPHYDAADFLPAASNEEALAWLARPADWPSGRLLIWGEEGVGKTHLLHVFARRQHAMILDAPALRGLPGLITTNLAIDDADAAAEEAALLHMLNAAAEARQRVLLTARTPPTRWPIRLPDLASRLRATTAVQLRPPEDSLLDALFARLLAERQLAVPAELQDWARRRLPRTPAKIRDAASRIDRAALEKGTRVTRQMLQDALAPLLDGDEDEDDDDFASTPGAASPAPLLIG